MNKKYAEILYYKNRILNSINKLMYDKGWSIKQLSEEAELPYESVKKLVGGKINNPTIYSIIKLSKAFESSPDHLLEWNSIYNLQSRHLPQRALTLLSEIANFEMYLHEYNQKYLNNNIPVLVPVGKFYDGMIFDSIFTDSINISPYQKDFKNNIMCGLKIVGKSLHPTYLDNDILLIAKDRFPLNREIGIFLIGHKIYIRKYIVSNPIELASVNHRGSSIKITDIDDIHFFGRVITVVRK